MPVSHALVAFYILPSLLAAPSGGDILPIHNVCSLLTEHWIRGPSHPGLKVTIFPGDQLRYRCCGQSQSCKQNLWAPDYGLVVEGVQTAPKATIAGTYVAGDGSGFRGNECHQGQAGHVYAHQARRQRHKQCHQQVGRSHLWQENNLKLHNRPLNVYISKELNIRYHSNSWRFTQQRETEADF